MIKAKVYWLSGLSGSGKTTIALGLAKKLQEEKGLVVKILDGDIIREGLNKDLGFTNADRAENIRRVAEVSKILIESGINCINCFISPTQEIRDLAREIIGKNHFVEVHIRASLAMCESRDTKGLYKKARAGIIEDFTGISAPYEKPVHPDIIIDTDKMSISQSIDKLFQFIV